MVSVLKKKRYWLAVLLALLLGVVTLLPFIFSAPSVTQMLVSRVNERIPGTLSIGSWLVGWQQGFLCQDIVYEDPQQGIRISIPRLTSTQGLIELLLTPRNLGLVSADSPVLELSGLTAGHDGSPAQAGPTASTHGKTAVWEKLALQLQVRDGLVKFEPRGSSPEIGIKDINLHSTLLTGEINVDIQFRTLSDQGEFAIKGRLNLPTRMQNLMETLFVEAEVSISDFQVQDYLSFAALHSNLPSGEGVLTADFHLATVGLEDFELSGSADVRDLILTGGFLGEDSPSLHEVSFSLADSEWSRLSWHINQLEIQSDVGTFFCSGQYRDRRMQLDSRGNVNIPVLFDQLPHLLKVHETALVETGALDFTAGFALDGSKGKFDFSTKAENLGGLFNGRPFIWEAPITAILHGENDGLDVKIRRLQVESPFLQAFGQGDLSSFSLEASADLGKTLAELGKLFQHPWSGEGDLELAMTAASTETADNYTVNTDLNISHFSLSRLDTVLVPNHHFSVVGSGHVPFSLLRERKGKFDLQFALSTWIGEVFFALNGEQEEDGLSGGRYSTDTNLQLDSISNLFQALDLFSAETKIGGDLQVQATGYIEKKIIGVDELNSRMHNFELSRGNVDFSDKDVRLLIHCSVNDEIPSLVIHDLCVTDTRNRFFKTGLGSNSIDFSSNSIFLHNIDLQAQLGTVQIDELVVGNWHELLDTMSAAVSADTDLTRLTPLLQNANLLASDTLLGGTGKLVFNAVEENKSRQLVTDLQVAGFSLSKDKKLLLPPDDIKLIAQLEELAAADNIAIKDLQLFTGPLDIAAAGTLTHAADAGELILQGTMIPKMDKLAEVLAAAFDVQVGMQGRKSQSFALHYKRPGKNGKPGGLVDFSSRLYADRVDYKGIRLQELSVPVTLQESRIQVDLQGRMNEGRLDLTASIDMNQEPAVFVVPENSRIMTGIQLEKPIVEGILQGIHPLFGVLASPSGQIDVRLDTFAWPVMPRAAYNSDFSTVIDVSQVDLDSSGLLRSILSAFALEHEKLKLRDAEVQCRGREGRITCSPVRILVAESEMILSGSVGMDSSLEYLLEVPVTPKLVSREVYQYLEGTTVKVPIGGTLAKPSLDKSSMTAAIRNLVKQAAGKVVEKQTNKVLSDLIEGLIVPQQKK